MLDFLGEEPFLRLFGHGQHRVSSQWNGEVIDTAGQQTLKVFYACFLIANL
jgi:hypothetical protein